MIRQRMAAALVTALAALVVAGAVTGANSHGLPGAAGTLWVTDKNPVGTTAVYDAGTGALLGIIPVGSSPIGVTAPHGTGKVYVSNESSNTMSVIGKHCLCVVGTIAMGPTPHHLMASKNGDRVYVGEFGQNTIGVVDTETDVEIAHYSASANPLARTHAVYVLPNGKDLYATNTRADRTQPGDIAKLDAQTGELLWNFPIGIDPSEILVTPNERTAYVTIRGENKIRVVDLSGHSPVVVGETVVGPAPDTLQLTTDGKTLVVALRGAPAQISLVDTDTLAVRHVFFPNFVSTGHHWLSANSKYTFVALVPGGVGVVDNDSGEVVRIDPYPGGVSPHGVFYEPRVLP